MCIIILWIMCLQGSGAVIYKLNDSQYEQMPPVVHLDSYKACQIDPDALYCTAEFVLVSDQPSPLLDMIKDYSEHQVSHFNHTKLRYGICVTQFCKTYYSEISGDLNWTLEACLNESFSNKYDLKVNILDGYDCHSPGKVKDIYHLDIIVGVIFVILVVFNVVGTLCDYLLVETKQQDIKFLLHFSLIRNWKKLIAPATANHEDSRMLRLSSLHGLRTISSLAVIILHSLLFGFVLLDNRQLLEEMYTGIIGYFLLYGALVIQPFLIMSSFLLVYPWLLQLEREQISWSMLPKRIIKRWFRLTPSYALTIALTATWFSHLSSGPFWRKYVSKESDACRQDGWQNLLYINNFFSHRNCAPHTWYLAVDTQLYCLAVIIFLACRTPRSRIITLSSLFIISMVIPAAIVYSHDLDGIQMAAPETAYELFVEEPHFNKVYTQSYCNMSATVIGMATAYLVYHLQKINVDSKKYQELSYRLIYWSMVPLFMMYSCSGAILYDDTPRPSVFIRTAFAAFSKPVISLLASGLIVGCIFKVEGIYRSYLEWSGWTVPSRLSYSAYLLHVTFVRNYAVSLSQTQKMSFLFLAGVSVCIILISYAASSVMWLMVETPFTNIVDKWMLKKKKD